MQQIKKIGPFMNIMCVTCNKAIFFLLTVCGPRCISTVILVDDLNIWFRRDLLSLIFKWSLQELLIIFLLFEHKWRSKHYILTQL
jgi:branched-subunit amino acid transport protein AzlD